MSLGIPTNIALGPLGIGADLDPNVAHGGAFRSVRSGGTDWVDLTHRGQAKPAEGVLGSCFGTAMKLNGLARRVSSVLPPRISLSLGWNWLFRIRGSTKAKDQPPSDYQRYLSNVCRRVIMVAKARTTLSNRGGPVVSVGASAISWSVLTFSSHGGKSGGRGR